MSHHTILDDKLMAEIAASEDAGNWLILTPQDDPPGTWLVQSLDPSFVIQFRDIIGSICTLAPSRLAEFLTRTENHGYHVAFTSDPSSALDAYDRLNDEPPFALASTLPGTVKGFLPFQVQGFNFLKDLSSGVAMWSTGTGKTVLAAALIKYHANLADFDYCWVIVKSHNKINTARTLERLADIECTVLDAPKEHREEILVNLGKAKDPAVIVTNYEKFRIDQAHILPLFEGKRVLLIWDEMPSKLKSRSTKLYKSIRKLLYRKVNLTEPRTAHARQYMLSATPIENNPEDWFNCIRLLNPKIYGPIKIFRDEYVHSYNPFSHTPAVWKNLDKMGQVAAGLTHQVDKSSPGIASQFPSIIEEPFYVDWNKEHKVLYEWLTDQAKKNAEKIFTEDGILGLIHVLQMMCCAPSMVQNSANARLDWELGFLKTKAGSLAAKEFILLLNKNLQDENFSKLDELRSLLTEQHPNEKVVIFSSFNKTLLPILSAKLDEWIIPHVVYGGNAKQNQQAQDYFTNEKDVRVFLSSDKGSDSINLEQASVVIHYDLPWKWSTYVQRQNRIHRVTSEHKTVRFYTLMMENSVEERKLKVLAKKEAYHQGVFKGATADQSESARMTKDDLLYILG